MQFGTTSERDAVPLDRDGAQRFESALDADTLKTLESALFRVPQGKARTRLKGIGALDPYLSIDGRIGTIAGSVLGSRSTIPRVTFRPGSTGSVSDVGCRRRRTID